MVRQHHIFTLGDLMQDGQCIDMYPGDCDVVCCRFHTDVYTYPSSGDF